MGAHNKGAGTIVHRRGGGLEPPTSNALISALQQLRLSAGGAITQPAFPVPVAPFVGATNLWVLPCEGNAIGLWDGARWNARASAGIAIFLGASPRTAGRPFDVFAYWDGAAVQASLTDWASPVARALPLLTVDGVYVSPTDPTHRYLGTVYARTATTYDWVTNPGADTAARLDVWNYYHRVNVAWQTFPSAASWTQPVAGVWRGANAVDTMRCEFVVGVAEEAFHARLLAGSDNTASSRAAAIGLDSTVAPDAACNYQHAMSSPLEAHCAELSLQPTIGFHFAEWIERAQGPGTPTWFGALADNYRYGLQGLWRA